MIETVAQAVVVKIVFGPAQSRGRQKFRTNLALMTEIVDGETNPLIVHPVVLVHLEQQYRHQPRLPVVAMDHVGALVRLEHELQRRLAEKREAHRIVRVPVSRRAVEEIVARVRLDEEASAPVDEAG